MLWLSVGSAEVAASVTVFSLDETVLCVGSVSLSVLSETVVFEVSVCLLSVAYRKNMCIRLPPVDLLNGPQAEISISSNFNLLIIKQLLTPPQIVDGSAEHTFI